MFLLLQKLSVRMFLLLQKFRVQMLYYPSWRTKINAITFDPYFQVALRAKVHIRLMTVELTERCCETVFYLWATKFPVECRAVWAVRGVVRVQLLPCSHRALGELGRTG